MKSKLGPLSRFASLPQLLLAMGTLSGAKLLGLIGPLFYLPLLALLICLSLVGMFAELARRRAQQQIFELGHVPWVPPESVLTGNLFKMIVPVNNKDVIEQHHKQLGPTFGIFYGPDPWICTIDPDLIQRVFVQDGHKNIDRADLRLPFNEQMNLSLAQAKGDTWRQTRRMLNPSFAHKQMKTDNVYDDINKSCENMLERLARLAKDEQAGRRVDVVYLFKQLAMDVIFRVAYAHELDTSPESDRYLERLIDIIDRGSLMIRGPIVWSSIMFDFFRHFWGRLAGLTPIGTFIRIIESVLADTVAQRRFQPAGKTDRKMVDTIVESFESKQTSKAVLSANLFFIFLAGFETTANTLTILTWLLAQHQTIQDKLRRSLVEQGEQSKYLEAVIKETLRLYPAVPLGVGRRLAETIEFKGMTLFRGTSILVSAASLHRSEQFWGPDAHEFRPERFEEARDTHPAQYFAFGLGPRYCMGSSLAMAEMRCAVAKLVLKYKLDLYPSTRRQLKAISPNLIHMIIEGTIDLRLTEISIL